MTQGPWTFPQDQIQVLFLVAVPQEWCCAATHPTVGGILLDYLVMWMAARFLLFVTCKFVSIL